MHGNEFIARGRSALETEIAVTIAWIGHKSHGLSPQVRAELVHLIEDMSNNARLERMIDDAPGDF